jgi:hypothetical protein
MTNTKIRKLPWIMIGILIISAIFYSATSIRPVSAQETAVLLVDPPTAAIHTDSTGAQFGVNVSIANITGFVGLQFTLNWDAGVVNCTSITENLFATLTPPDQSSNIWKVQPPKYNNTDGSAIYGVTWQDMGAAQDGGYAPANITEANYPEGKLAAAVMTFNVTTIPATGSYVDVTFNITLAKAGDIAGAAIPISAENATYRIYGPPIINTVVTPITWNGQTYNVTTVSNETVVDGTVAFVGDPTWSLSFNLTGTDGDVGYVNVTIPMGLMIGPFNVTINGAPVTPQITSDETNTYIYVTAQLSTEPIEIIGTIPEFTLLFIPLLMATTLIAYAVRRRRRL